MVKILHFVFRAHIHRIWHTGLLYAKSVEELKILALAFGNKAVPNNNYDYTSLHYYYF